MVHIWNDPTEVPKDFGPTVVTIGNFDGVHRGHQHVLSQLTDTAKRHNIPSVAVTFDPHPAQVHRPDSAPELIMGLQDKLEALGDTGVDAVLVMKYTLDLAAMTPLEFVREVLLDGLNAAHLVVGHDLRFGAGNAGDVVTMQELGDQLGFGVQVVNEYGAGGFPVHDDGDTDRRCSSTWVREALSEGDVVTAAAILGRPHRMRGEVVHGAARGRDLGFPTANLSHDSTGYVPADGIYAGWLIDQAGTRWPAAISVGSNPTFDGVSRQVEAHVIDRPQENVEDFDLYGQTVAVEFTQRLRGMVAYRGPEALVEQMCLDVAQAHELLTRH
ncbi:bifunctional riboflavin kinase/FAD synthetase [Paenarthrobacter nitroguajacolicus]|uniref:bifunctional riboflavin kinase/FAD synthetase n=1 Tax=Paenarthrobacter nitroguajacolicus TaxID=211146 RepID=UPI0015C0B71C|nr:bifunctional riboflavin kinase/FAD synthetase [Paenarthrobacter nitroguajacolicus]NWL12777.1 bifunctional riboflavin kinase/FAD synthetase [Paenarthrobacter nitroguajacolicus]NWL34779.1 bifunctional riboflavin kinase/FAD synthetase [Paenarthrobacter nitroguajacolicus]